MTDEELRMIEARAQAATPGPWTACTDGTSWVEAEDDGYRRFPATDCPERDVAFIAASRSDVPALCAAVRAAWAERDEARALLWAAAGEKADTEQRLARAETVVEEARAVERGGG